MPRDYDRWPTDEFGRFERQFTRYLSPHTAKLATLDTEVKARKHPFGFVLAGTILTSIVATISAFNIAEFLGYLGGVGGLASSLYVGRINSTKNKALKQATDAVDDYVSREILPIDYINMGERDPDILSRFQALGAFGRYDTVHHLSGVTTTHEDTEPLFTHTRLTRTETETYTDSQGRRRTRTRIVPVFHGILFDMAFPGTEGDHRTIISTRRISAPTGPFAREAFGKRLKMQAIKPASLEFQKRFKVMADDAMLGHEILDPDRVMRFINLHDDLIAQFGKGADIIMLLMGEHMWVSIETGPLSNPADATRNIDKLRPAMTLLGQQLSVRQIFASHLRLPEPAAFAWQSADDAAQNT